MATWKSLPVSSCQMTPGIEVARCTTAHGLLPHNVHASVHIASCVTFVYAVCNIHCVSRVQTLVVCISCRRR